MRAHSCLLTPFLLLVSLFFSSAGGHRAIAGSSIAIIPKPLKIEETPGKFAIDARTRILVDKKSGTLGDVATFLAGELRRATGFPLPVVLDAEVKGAKNAILLSVPLTGKPTGAEGYELTVTPNFVRIAAQAPAGVFYGEQTLFQLLPAEFEEDTPVRGVAWEIPCVFVEDAPRFAWRGMHLDVGRHFMPKQFVKRYIDLLARYKFNTFHWHLTEDQGWRIEIKKYPRLTAVGAWRKETTGDGQPYGGYYSQGDVREIVAYAREHFITIVPEIEMPGHATALLAAYPELSCTGGPFDVGTHWDVFDDVLCPGKEKTFIVLQDILSEVMQLFPGTYIHVGGDECPKVRWKECPACQARMKSEGLASEHELQSYFTRRIEKFLNANGRRLVGWDEILEGGLAANATVMSWRGTEGGIAAARSGHDVVMTPTSACYFDYAQGRTGEPEGNDGYLPLDTVYAYEPIPAVLSADEAKHILGVQGNVWTERMPDARMVEYMVFPRACALAEVAWSDPTIKGYGDFCGRMAVHDDRLAAHGVNVRIPPPTGFEGSRTFFGTTEVTPAHSVPGSTVRYTVDGTEPNGRSPVLGGSITVRSNMVLKARTFLGSGLTGPVATGYYSVVDPAADGVEYRVYEGNGAGEQEAGSQVAVASGIAYGLAIDAIPHREKSAVILLKGKISVERDGVYSFWIIADDRSLLSIDKMPVVVDTSGRGRRESLGRISLKGGLHDLSLRFEKGSSGSGFNVFVEGPGLERQRVPAGMLHR